MSLATSVVAGSVAVTVVIVVAAAASPDRRMLFGIFRGPRRPAMHRDSRAGFALAAFGALSGLALALGFAPGSVLALLGAMAAVTVGRGLMAGGLGIEAPGHLIGVAWALIAGAARYGTADLSALLAAQAILGPSALVGPPGGAALSAAAGIIALGSGALWLRALPPIPEGPQGAFLRWMEVSLVAAACAAIGWGPGPAAALGGPFQLEAALRALTGFAAALTATAALSSGAGFIKRLPSRPAGWILGASALALMVASGRVA
ncbi:MAG: hypothetical protein ACRDI1_10300 [Actinomycetota bacterium]